MAKLISVLATGIVLLAAMVRGGAIWNAPIPRPEALLSTRDCVRQFLRASGNLPKHFSSAHEVTISPALPSLLDHHVTRIEFRRFDPGAVVLIRAGRDGQPGVARVDDDRNGTIDDRSELGATHSDDVCSVELDDIQDEAALVLQYGAFVPATYDQLIGSTPARAVVFGQSAGGDRWSFMVEL